AHQRISAEEAAEGRVVEACAEMNEPEGLERVAAVPLVGGVHRAAGLGISRRRRLAEGPVVDRLLERAGVVREEPISTPLADREDPGPHRAMPRCDQAAGSGDAPLGDRADRRRQAARAVERERARIDRLAALDEPAEVPVVTLEGL